MYVKKSHAYFRAMVNCFRSRLVLTAFTMVVVYKASKAKATAI
jgi:hypothetical protein